jgi:hypothetical protein
MDATTTDMTAYVDRSSELKKVYEEATSAQRKVIDVVFIAMCGWSLDTLIMMSTGQRQRSIKVVE